MRNLIKSDFLKIKNSKSFWICLLYIIISVCSRAFLDQFGLEGLPGADMVGGISDGNDPTLFETLMNAAGNNIATVLPIAIPLFICNEFAYGAYKNIVSKGIKKENIYISKMIICWTITGIYYLFTLIGYTAINTIFYSIGELTASDFLKTLIVIVVQLLLFEAMCTVIVFLGFVFKSAAIVIPISFCILRFFPPVVNLVSHIKNNKALHNFAEIQLQNLIDTVCTSAVSYSDLSSGFVVAVVYLLVFVILTGLIFKKTEIK